MTVNGPTQGLGRLGHLPFVLVGLYNPTISPVLSFWALLWQSYRLYIFLEEKFKFCLAKSWILFNLSISSSTYSVVYSPLTFDSGFPNIWSMCKVGWLAKTIWQGEKPVGSCSDERYANLSKYLYSSQSFWLSDLNAVNIFSVRSVRSLDHTIWLGSYAFFNSK